MVDLIHFQHNIIWHSCFSQQHIKLTRHSACNWVNSKPRQETSEQLVFCDGPTRTDTPIILPSSCTLCSWHLNFSWHYLITTCSNRISPHIWSIYKYWSQRFSFSLYINCNYSQKNKCNFRICVFHRCFKFSETLTFTNNITFQLIHSVLTQYFLIHTVFKKVYKSQPQPRIKCLSWK